mmetsp:Transcript_55461/g.154573  ORF Transcript_55461/g.154573 Transcript_55461/m.154573 type:complete len:305 (+) Transcript_55461:153-1067(+)|eukprot:CAMPEP_0117549584 /NCGR_PEP_ID=MMETSP0784-20121206/48241_1 /TAXON_ID=39447 /ORGANISM="" /LENGTH=304 /DNA_ID=CAMNT_0005346577 /DNA_START=52 /DNA_END=966 /DNA_ORIENTATION=-
MGLYFEPHAVHQTLWPQVWHESAYEPSRQGPWGADVASPGSWREPWSSSTSVAGDIAAASGRHDDWHVVWQPKASEGWHRSSNRWDVNGPNVDGPAPWGSSAAVEQTAAGAFVGALPEEPGGVLLVNSESSGAYSSLCADAAEADLVAFDAEWAPDWHRGSDNPVSVLQLAFPCSGRVYVLQLGHLGNRLPQAVQMMLVNPGVMKVGFAVGCGDAAKLKKSGIALTRGSVIDMQSWSASALRLETAPQTLSLKRAADNLLGFKLQKDKRCTCSDWSSDKLTPEQIHYAALDAWVALRLYYAVAA